MAAFNFPNSPSTNDIHNENGVSFKWNGTVWKKIGTVANQLSQLGVTGISTFSNDVSIADKIIHTGDTNTSLRFPSADTITAETGGSERIRIDSNGRLMVGQNSAYAATGTGNMMLTVTKDATSRTDAAISNQSSGNNASAAVVLATHGQDYILEATGSGNTTDGVRAFRILKGTSERLRIDTNGNVGIGSAIPGEVLDVNGSIRSLANNYTTMSATFDARYDATHLLSLTVNHNSSTASEVLGTYADSGGSNPRTVINASNGWKVGIGSAIPVSKFDVADGTTGISFNRTNNTPEIHFRSNNVDECGEIRVGESSGGGVMDLKTKTTSGTLTTRLSLDTSGNSIFKGSGTDVTISPTDGLINFGMDGRTSFVTGTNACYIYSGSGASGTIPAGTLILQSRSNVDRDIVFVAGSSPTERMRIKAGGAIDLSVSGTEADIYHSGSGDRWPLRLLNSDTTSGNMTGIYFGPCNNVAGAYISGKAEADFTSTANRDAGLEFGTRLDGNWKIPMAISAAGYVNKPLTPYFKANLSSGVRITSTGYAVFGSAVHNNGSHYNTSDGKFTAPIAGLYWLSCKINAYDRIDFTIRVNGSTVEKGQYNTDNDNVGWWSNQLTTITYMTAGQYAQVHVNHLDQNADPDTWCTFMGYLIC